MHMKQSQIGPSPDQSINQGHARIGLHCIQVSEYRLTDMAMNHVEDVFSSSSVTVTIAISRDIRCACYIRRGV
jgi:hypothetical protein